MMYITYTLCFMYYNHMEMIPWQYQTYLADS